MEGHHRTPPKKENRTRTIQELYQSSLKKEVQQLKMCLLCLLCSSDCDNTRCSNPTHVTCRECTYEWVLDKSCPICRNNNFSTIRKPRRSERTSPAFVEPFARGYIDGEKSQAIHESSEQLNEEEV
jgi:hypothetical protein